MTLYVGEAITIRCDATNTLTGEVITDATATVEFFAPGKNPAKVPADREVDHGPISMTYDEASQSYVGFVDTGGWAAGKWSYRVTFTGTYDAWEYAAFKLVA